MDTATAHPRAYFITFHTHGSWLPGDPRGSIDRNERAYGSVPRGPCPALMEASLRQMRSPPVELTRAERVTVQATIVQACAYRGWELYAANVLSNHVHLLARAPATPERVMGDVKAYATRRVIAAGHRPEGTRLWARHGSTRWLWRSTAVVAAQLYVVHGQGEGVPGAVFEGRSLLD